MQYSGTLYTLVVVYKILSTKEITVGFFYYLVLLFSKFSDFSLLSHYF